MKIWERAINQESIERKIEIKIESKILKWEKWEEFE